MGMGFQIADWRLRIGDFNSRSSISNLQSPISNLQFRFSKVSPPSLFTFDGLEERLEVPLPKTPGALSLNDLVEASQTFLYRLGEDMHQAPPIVPVNKEPEHPQGSKVFVDRPDAIEQRVVIR